MNEIWFLFGSFAIGILLGIFFFGGLWWTTKKGLQSKNAGLWFAGSFVVRLVITITGFYLVGHDHLELIMVCLLGFMVARALIKWRTQTTEVKQQPQ